MYGISIVVVSSYHTNCYLVDIDGAVLIVDPGDNAALIREAIGARPVLGIVLTHCHSDHIGAVNDLVGIYGCDVFVGEGDDVGIVDPHLSGFDEEGSDYKVEADPRILHDGDEITWGAQTFTILATPGHTPGSICLYDDEGARLFSGDTLFKGGWGRTDFVRGDFAAMRRSLARLFSLPREVEVYPGHGPSTTIGKERSRWT
ncbi:MBL fold metallo-hydrolase [Arcanobacterium haemolyticum]|nr:MBL fold metallo-hydrolase [Arcanobacterium haemolyticum]